MGTLPDVSESTDNTSSDSKEEIKKIKVFAYLTPGIKKNRIEHCASTNDASIISLKCLYMET